MDLDELVEEQCRQEFAWMKKENETSEQSKNRSLIEDAFCNLQSRIPTDEIDEALRQASVEDKVFPDNMITHVCRSEFQFYQGTYEQNDQVWDCKICGRRFKSEEFVRAHVSKRHSHILKNNDYFRSLVKKLLNLNAIFLGKETEMNTMCKSVVEEHVAREERLFEIAKSDFEKVQKEDWGASKQMDVSRKLRLRRLVDAERRKRAVAARKKMKEDSRHFKKMEERDVLDRMKRDELAIRAVPMEKQLNKLKASHLNKLGLRSRVKEILPTGQEVLQTGEVVPLSLSIGEH